MYYDGCKLFLILLCVNAVIGVPLTSGYYTNGTISDTHSVDIADLSVYGASLYGRPDFNKTGNAVAKFESTETSVNPEELGSYLEGDIIMPQSSPILKSGINSKAHRWPDGEVPFEIDNRFTNNERAVITFVINEYHTKTCIRFKPRTTEANYISIIRENSGCWSAIGRVGGKQQVNLQAECFRKPGTVIHELMHVLGFMHEQNRRDRDSFVAIQFQNVERNAESNFVKMPNTFAFGIEYDFGSVMHYSPRAFSRNGRPTIVAKKPVKGQIMGQRNGFSPRDIEKINRMYNCKQKTKVQRTPITRPAIASTRVPSAQWFSNNKPFGTLVGSIFKGFNRFGNQL